MRRKERELKVQEHLLGGDGKQKSPERTAFVNAVLAVGPGGCQKERPSGWRANSWEGCPLTGQPLDFTKQIKTRCYR